jgi:hypothetical protein
MKKVGRNDECPCGSGKKYKKCCLDLHRGPAVHADRDEQGRLTGRPEIETVHPSTGQRFVATGTGVSWAPATQTRHEFYIQGLRRAFGKDWHESQQALPETDRHPVELWNAQFEALKAGKIDGAPIERESATRFSAPMTSDVMALLCLGYDTYTVQHAAKMHEDLRKRLKDRDQFQGARYELAIAAVFARAGYEIEWIRDLSRPRPEFKARHRSSGSSLVVEAKSRHRKGVLGRPGQPPTRGELELDVSRLMRRALKKETDGLPYVICLDLNMPTDQHAEIDPFIHDVYEKVLFPFSYDSTGEPDPFSGLLVTNYSWHWGGQTPPDTPALLAFRGDEAAASVPLKEFELIVEAVFQYGQVPA